MSRSGFGPQKGGVVKRSRLLVAGLGVGLIGRAVSALTAPICLAIVSRSAASDGLVDYLLFAAFVGLAGSGFQLGLRAQFARAEADELGGLARLAGLTSAAAFFAGLVLGGLVGVHPFAVGIALATFPLEAAGRGKAARSADGSSLIALNVARGVTRVSAFAVLAMQPASDISPYLLAWALTHLIPVVALLLRFRLREGAQLHPATWKLPLRQSALLAAAALGPTALQRLDVALASRVLPGDEAGAYLATRQLMDLPVVLISAIETFAIPFFVRSQGEDGISPTAVASTVGILTFTSSIPLVLLSERIIKTILGRDVTVGLEVWILALGAAFASASALLAQALYANRNEITAAKVSLGLLGLYSSLLAVAAAAPSRVTLASSTAVAYAGYASLMFRMQQPRSS